MLFFLEVQWHGAPLLGSFWPSRVDRVFAGVADWNLPTSETCSIVRGMALGCLSQRLAPLVHYFSFKPLVALCAGTRWISASCTNDTSAAWGYLMFFHLGARHGH